MDASELERRNEALRLLDTADNGLENVVKLIEEKKALEAQRARDFKEWEQLVFERNVWSKQAERLADKLKEETRRLEEEKDVRQAALNIQTRIGERLFEENEQLRKVLELFVDKEGLRKVLSILDSIKKD